MTPAASIILQYSRALPSAMGGSLASSSTMALSTSVTGECRQHVLDRLNLRVALGQRRRAVGLADVVDARFDLRFALQIHATKADPAVGRRRQKVMSPGCRCAARPPNS